MKLAVPAILRVRSLSFRLYVLILLALVLMLLVQLVIAHLEISRTNSRQVVSDLRMSAQAYADLTTLNMDDVPRREEFLRRLTDIKLGLSLPNILPGEFRYVLCDRAGNVITAFPGAPTMPCGKAHDTVVEIMLEGKPWRSYTVDSVDGKISATVAQPLAAYERAIRDLFQEVAVALAILASALMVMVGWAAHQGLKPLRTLTRQVEARDSADLDPVQSVEHAELKPLVEALNGLFARVRRGIEADRRFFADAAHELRTPLAAIQAQAYVVSHSDSEDDRSTALREFDRGISRATQSLAKLLAIARLDARRVEAQLAQGALSDLAGCARSGVIQQASRAERRNITLSYDGANQAWVSVSHEDAATLVENVLDNAVRETPNGGEVRVAVKRIEQAGVPMVELRIEDSGPGIPPDERDRVFERFYRPRTSQSQGSGLGLAIVRRIVELGNGSVAIEDGLAHAEGRGCAIVIRLPALESAPEPIEPDDAPPGMADTRGH
ncbi:MULTISPECIES: ATP-binding protein [Ralstonia]|jgi:signal transduction histidine kinase|uniref:histidine kinase n=1 Tax=Ralstonia pickettii TaxID=329 RepID=A0ABN9HTK7_RALPI|nr:MULTISPECIES: ATP-binding protein [Ralstonia]MBA4203113.1 two-component sensor histidine kinase [Ralstonia sp.]MBA4229472.1 two-component sensor histidine kinase [Ralstonia sp.]MBA4236499.1 two-component sensor histidine kinase [Ralstonia sp.]MBA4280355.1 two-component sensor histidine kinase [Ralstonia sp.]MBA4297922.1 two-component sensor histidine kinase [Ralstonia sp.]